MIAELSTILASSGAGSIIGGVFSWLNRKEEAKERANEREFKIAMVGANASAEEMVAEARAFEESQKTVSSVGGAIKSAIRPLITGVLMYQTYVILTGLESIVGGIETLDDGEALQLYRDIVLNIISLTATSVSWWFGARPTNRGK
jgi:hypothetical protein